MQVVTRIAYFSFLYQF